jgi:HlyD family secretion protein
MRPFPPLLLLGALTLAACNGDGTPDAYGNFEADDVVVAAQTAGPIVRFEAVEGQPLATDALVAVIDTIPLALERQQLVAQRGVLISRRREAAAQLASVDAQLALAERALERVQRLRDGEAATASQLDGAERDVTVLGAQREALRASDSSLGAELAALDARIATVADRIDRAQVRSPIAGTVLTTYVRLGETTQPGQALFSIADLGTMTLRAYVTGDQLARFALGQRVTVRVTLGDSLIALPGDIAWVSSRAEFTPTPIQTRDERADLVYAVKIRVADPQGRLKIGMPGDVTLAGTP